MSLSAELEVAKRLYIRSESHHVGFPLILPLIIEREDKKNDPNNPALWWHSEQTGGGMKEEQPCDPLTIGSFCSISVEVDAAHSERATLDLWEVADL